MTKTKSAAAPETQRQKAHLTKVVEAGGKQLRLLLNKDEWERFEAIAAAHRGGQKAALMAMVDAYETNALTDAQFIAQLAARLGVVMKAP
jgi:phosphoribosyl-dephospho-CoA transferase